MMALGLVPAEDAGRDEALLDSLARRPLRILLAEDSVVNQKLAVGLLERHGHTVAVAHNGREVLATLDGGDYDVVLMDVQMPEMDGLEATSLIRERERQTGAHVPIIAMTAHAMRGDRETCLTAGMDGYISKPIRATKLFETLHAIVERTVSSNIGDAFDLGDGTMDWSKALAVVQGDRELLKEVVVAFLDEYPRILDEIRNSIDGRDHALLRRSAHKLKGATRYLGAQGAYDYAFSLECMGRDGTTQGATATLKLLEEEIDRLKPNLTVFAETGQFASSAGSTKA
jgi:CheY-like chemotaxis protein/HPt (histidine-containing phosphotransfer) domain-containing protein